MKIRCIQGVGERLIVLTETDEIWMLNCAHLANLDKRRAWVKLQTPWDEDRKAEVAEKLLAEAIELIPKRSRA